MSALKHSGMRIIALPLTATSSHATGRFTYYHFQMPQPQKAKEKNLVQKAVSKASSLWAGLGKAEEGSWKRRAFKYGERLVDRLDFEELALKSIDPSLGPQITQLGRRGVEIDQEKAHSIPLIHPTIRPSTSSLLFHLQGLLEHRTPLHRRGFWFWLGISPITAPFALIPIIPNFPFFYCVWRSWSHYRAYKASTYLESLIEHDVLSPAVDGELDLIYALNPPSPQERVEGQRLDSPAHRPSTPSEHIILSRKAVPQIVERYGLPPSAASDLYRALEQTARRLAKESS